MLRYDGICCFALISGHSWFTFTCQDCFGALCFHVNACFIFLPEMLMT